MGKKLLRIFVLGILAGIAISFGSAGFVACSLNGDKILGSVFFSVGLLLVCSFGFKLYTGQIGKVFENKKSFLLDLLVMYIGNFVGALFCGFLSSMIITSDAMSTNIMNIANGKVIGENLQWYQLLIQSFFCGMLVYLGVEIFKKAEKGAVKVAGLVLCVAVFVIAGFSHCIANMYYLSAARLFISDFGITMLSILLSTIGNSLGAIFTWVLFYLGKEKVDSVQA